MERTKRLLVVTSDPLLRSEFTAAVDSTASLHPQLTFASDYRQAIESARARSPALVFADLDEGIDALKSFCDEVETVSPQSVVVGVFQDDRMSDGQTDRIIAALRSHARDFLRRPVSSTELSSIYDRWIMRPHRRSSRSGAIVSFISNKGGVGKSTMAVNTATAITAVTDMRVLLVDLSLQLGVCASMLDLAPSTTIVDAVREHDRLDETMLEQMCTSHSSGLRLLAAPTNPDEAAEVTVSALTRILGLSRRAFDIVIVDTFPLLDELVVELVDLSDLIYLVFHGMVPAALGAEALANTLDGLQIPPDRRRLILNQNYPRFVGELRPEDIARRLQRDIDHVIPYNKQLLVASNAGSPLGLRLRGRFGFGRALGGVRDEIVGLPGQTRREVES
ncbi:hypothetical protein ABI59_07215 [Acidobacteria bacterium Mor1]|nr:hypothetical protein ABI59_07215 [Acidobacteria bacterium Mor1]